MLFWHVALQMCSGPMSMACNDNSGQGEYRREHDFLQILTAEECSTGREGTRLEGGSSALKKDQQYFPTSDISGGFNALQLLEVCVWSVVTKGNMEV